MPISAPPHRTPPAPAASPTASPAARRTSGAFQLLTVLAFDLVAIIAFHAAGTHPWATFDWFSADAWFTTPPETVVIAILRVGGLILAYWVGATTIVYLVGRLGRLPGLVRSIEWATLPSVRRATDKFVALSVVASTLATPAMAVADEAPPVPVVVAATSAQENRPLPGNAKLPAPAADGDADADAEVNAENGGADSSVDETTSTDAMPIGALGPIPVLIAPGIDAPDAPPAPDGPSHVEAQRGGAAQIPMSTVVDPLAPADAPPDPFDFGFQSAFEAQYTVVVGDNMWDIAQRRVHAASVDATDRDVAEYWVAIVDANRDTIRSGDPDLIFPGETITLPAMEDS